MSGSHYAPEPDSGRPAVPLYDWMQAIERRLNAIEIALAPPREVIATLLDTPEPERPRYDLRCEVCGEPANVFTQEILNDGMHAGWRIVKPGERHDYCGKHAPAPSSLTSTLTDMLAPAVAEAMHRPDETPHYDLRTADSREADALAQLRDEVEALRRGLYDQAARLDCRIDALGRAVEAHADRLTVLALKEGL